MGGLAGHVGREASLLNCINTGVVEGNGILGCIRGTIDVG